MVHATKKILLACVALLLLAGCSTRHVPTETELTNPNRTVPSGLWTKDMTPERVAYERQWEYSAMYETDNPVVIGALIDAVKALEIGEEDESATQDYTDILTFYFGDGETLRLEFENQNLVTEDGTRYQVDGLGELRRLLDGIAEEGS